MMLTAAYCPLIEGLLACGSRQNDLAGPRQASGCVTSLRSALPHPLGDPGIVEAHDVKGRD